MSTNPTQPTNSSRNEDFIELGEEVTQGLSKRRKSTSKVWKDFDKIETPSGEVVARCKHCKREFVGGSSKGTSHLLKHLDGRCPALKHLDVNASRNVSTPKMPTFKFDQERSRMDFAKMIIKHNYPFNMAEHEFFEIFCNNLEPRFKLVSRNTIRGDVLAVYQVEKENLYKFLDELSCKITLTTDLWTSDHQNFAYICLTAHYVTDDWELKKKILAYKYIEYPHDGETLFRVIKDLILEWNIDKKLFSMVVDNATNNDVMIRLLKDWLCDKSILALGGELFHVRCSAHILNLIVQDGLKVIGNLISKVRESVKYVNRSPYAKQKFDLAVNQVKLQGKKKLPMDVPTRWNSTYLMLEAAIGLKSAFFRLEQIDKNYKHNPSESEWEIAKVICGCLKLFYDSTSHFSGVNFPTSNVFFPDICLIQLQLKEWEIGEHESLRLMAGPMLEKFEKYWEDCCLVLAIAVVLDPRCKLVLVQYYFGRIYGGDAQRRVDRVQNAFIDIFHEYRGASSHSMDSSELVTDDGSSSGSQLVSSSSKQESLSNFFEWYMRDRASNIHTYEKSELEQYLEEPVFPSNENFNILHWWKINSTKLPILARMARDILAVPATTVASEAAFSVGGRVIDETRASLLPDIVEALVTANDWIESYKKRNVEECSLND